MQKKKKLNMTMVLLLIGFVPLLLTGIISCVVAAVSVSNNLTDQVYKKLYVASDGLRQYYQYDIDSGLGVDAFEYEHTYVDMLKSEDIEMTLFIGDTRFITSALNAQGQRNEGTKMDPAIWAKVQRGETVYAHGVVIGGKPYYVCYMPLKETNGSVLGAAWAGQPETDVQHAINSVVLQMLVIIFLATVIFGAIIWTLAKRVVRSLHALVGNVDTLAQGKLSDEDMVESGIAEISQIVDGITIVQNQLNKIITNTKQIACTVGEKANDLADTAAQMSHTADDVSTAVQEIASGATTQADNIQDAATETSHMGADVENISNNIDTLNTATQQMGDNCQSTKDALNGLIVQANKVVESVQAISATIERTNQSAKKIAEFTEAINTIATQTNLLSLNATIEAARAGDAGRGFAVVAGEISGLAAQSKQSADQIKLITAELMQDANDSVAVVTQLNEDIENQNKQLDATKDSMVQMEEGIASVVTGTSEITSEVGNLQKVRNVLDNAIQDLSAISEENAASTEETGASMEELAASVALLATAANELKNASEQLNSEMEFFQE